LYLILKTPEPINGERMDSNQDKQAAKADQAQKKSTKGKKDDGCCDSSGGCSDLPLSATARSSNSQGGGGASGGGMQSLERDQLIKIRKAMELLQLQQGGASGGASAAVEAAARAAAEGKDGEAKKTYKFWSTQPVPKIDEEITAAANEAISADVPLDQLRQEPYSLPQGFEWDTLNLDDPLVLKELYVLLNENYVEDDDNMFRFDYSPEFLRWALLPPGFLKEWHVGVRATKSRKLVGFISAVPASVSIYKKTVKMVEINFLCVHKKLRSKRVAPVLIREITRRVNCQGLFQAVYTAGVVLPKPVGTCRYWHRSLNPKKLIEVKFSHLSRNMTMQRHLKLYRLPDSTKIEGIRKMKATDIPEACKLLNEYLSRFSLVPVFTEEDFQHWFLPREDIIDTYVVDKPDSSSPTGLKITDLVSFYTLPSTVMNHPTHNNLKAAYSFYNVATSASWVDLIGDALVLAKKANFDVFNALDLMDNSEFLEKLKFGIGDGNLQYYLYNWRCPTMQPKDVGLVLQ